MTTADTPGRLVGTPETGLESELREEQLMSAAGSSSAMNILELFKQIPSRDTSAWTR
ncbi:MAG: hypothetical protein HY791_14410 [Deltaproteobacteria bacterium]|nr:hypothetical protein [Deltaproteobacteria bacterium]